MTQQYISTDAVEFKSDGTSLKLKVKHFTMCQQLGMLYATLMFTNVWCVAVSHDYRDR
jgi:hypothetical protein